MATGKIAVPDSGSANAATHTITEDTVTKHLQRTVLSKSDGSEIDPRNVGGFTKVFDVTLSLDTAAYAAGDVLADTQVLTSLFRANDGTGVLQSIQIVDQDDQKAAIDFYFLTANNSLGTENAAPSISDANAVELLGPFSVSAADYKDLGGVSVAKIANIGQPIKAASGVAHGYIAAILSAGTPTFTASGIKLRLGVMLD